MVNFDHRPGRMIRLGSKVDSPFDVLVCSPRLGGSAKNNR